MGNTHTDDLLANPTHIPGWFDQSDLGGTLIEGYDPVDQDKLASWVNKAGWSEWDGAYRGWERQVEENVRMVAGRQYDAYIPELGEFLDISEWVMSKDEQWRQYPTFNWIAHYYKITLSKLTENLPSMGFVPAGSDWEDAQLARIMEPIWKHQWHRMEMPEHMFTLYAWVIIASRAISKLRWDPDAGPREELRGDATLQSLDGNAVTGRVLTDAPYIRGPGGELKPNFLVDAAGDPIIGDDGQPKTGPADSDFMGDLAFDTLVPTSVRTPHNSDPFHKKAWYTQQYLMSTEDIERRFGIEVEPTDMAASSSLFLKLAYGENYGMPSSWMDSLGLGNVEDVAMRGMVSVNEHWRTQQPGHPILDRGRLTLATDAGVVLYDDINPFWTETHRQAVNPFDAFDAVPVPFRNEGMGDLEILNPIQKAMNRREAAMQDAVDHAEQPITFFNENTIDEIDVDKFNQPGEAIAANLGPGVGEPAFRLQSPGLPEGSFQLANHMLDFLKMFGSLPQGAEGIAATADASGELQREVRFDTDRVWGTTLRLHSYVWSRIALKMGHLMSACLTDERLVVLAGEDMAAEFVMIGPEMFTGRINAIPQPESQVLESRQEKQNRLMQLVSFGMPIEVAMQTLNYPDLNRALRPGAGGAAFAMAQRENLEMLLGQLSPVLPRHDHQVHTAVHVESMQSPSYRDLPPETQQLFELHVFMHEQFLQAAFDAALEQQAQAQGAIAPEGGGGSGDAGNSSSEGAPTGEEQKKGATQPGAPDPRSAQLSLTG